MTVPFARGRNILDVALSSLRRRRARNLSLLAVYTAIVFLLASLLFLVQALKREAGLLLEGAPDLVVQRLSAGRHDLIPAAHGEAIAAIRGVTAVTPRLWGYYYDRAFGANYTLLVPPGETIAPGTVAVGDGVARSQRVAAGDLVNFRTSRGAPLLLAVSRIFPADSDLVAADLVLLSAADYQTLFDPPAGQATDLAVSVGNPHEIPTVAVKIIEQLPDVRVVTRAEIRRTYDAIFDWRGGLIAVVLGVAVLAFAILAWDRAAGLSAEERREIGILKGIGWDTADVLLLKLWEGSAISLTAFLAGTLLAWAHVFLFSAGLFEQTLKGWSVVYPSFRLAPDVDAYQLAVIFCLSVVPYTAATVIPSWLAASADPEAAMRSTP